MVGTIVVGATCTEKLYRMMVAVHPNRCFVVNVVVVAAVQNSPPCVRRNLLWKWKSAHA